MFWAVDYACLAVMVICGALVVHMKNLSGAVMALSAVGTVMSLLFVVLGAPDDAHAEVVVGTIALPTMYLVAIGKIRGNVPDRGELGEEDHDAGSN